MPLDLQLERVNPSGSMMSSGILNQLGRPNLDTLAVLIREAFQNSWDARSQKEAAITFGIHGYQLNEQQRKFLKGYIFADTPGADYLSLFGVLNESAPIDALVIYDRGTTGLSGPTRADIIAQFGETSNFVNFMRNIGQPSERVFSGGTYGYGKAAFYRVSRARTICVYTQCKVDGGFETRFMAASLGQPFSIDGRRYTGRFWWGIKDTADTELVEPLRGPDADRAAEEIGIPTFIGNECGTNILVLQPHWGERTPLQAVNLMAEMVLWNFWPKLMMQATGSAEVKAEASWEGNKVEIPAPEAYPPLQGFVKALQKISVTTDLPDEALPDSVHRLRSIRPKQVLGHFAVQNFSRSDFSVFDTGLEPSDGAFSSIFHHTALMRHPKLVVKYLPGPEPDSSAKSYAGVFVASDELDSIFAAAETPTHDDWVADSLDQRQHRVFVNQALSQLDRTMRTFALTPVSPIDPAQQIVYSVTGIARRLGKFLAPNSHTAVPQQRSRLPQQRNGRYPLTGVSDPDTAIKRSRNNSRAHILPCSQRLVLWKQEVPAVQVEFIVEHEHGSLGTHVEVAIDVLLDGRTREQAPPIGQRSPQLIYWLDSFGQQYPGTETVFFSVDNRDVCSLLISVPDDVMIHIELTAALAE